MSNQCVHWYVNFVDLHEWHRCYLHHCLPTLLWWVSYLLLTLRELRDTRICKFYYRTKVGQLSVISVVGRSYTCRSALGSLYWLVWYTLSCSNNSLANWSLCLRRWLWGSFHASLCEAQPLTLKLLPRLLLQTNSNHHLGGDAFGLEFLYGL